MEKINNVKKIKPMYTKVVLTANKYVESGNDLIVDVSKLKSGLTEYQKVIAVGPSVRDVKVGDIVCFKPDRYAQKQFAPNSVKADLMTNQVMRYNFPMVTLDGVDYLLVDEIDIEFIIEEYE